MFKFQNIPQSINLKLKTWRVSANWVIGLKEFNELMNEEDYEVEENGTKSVHPLSMSVEDFFNKGELNDSAARKPGKKIE